MPVKRSKIDLFPASGMDLRTEGGVRWMRNMRRWTASSPLEVRPGFGQRAQIDSTTGISNTYPNKATGGYTQFLGSYIHRTNFGHKQLLSVFAVEASHSDSTEADMTGTGAAATTYLQAHGVSVGIVFSIFDLTTQDVWEELLPIKTSEFVTNEPSDTRPMAEARGHMETRREKDHRGFKSPGSSFVSFSQVADSVYFSSPDIGIWVYRGIDVPSKVRRQRIVSQNPDPMELIGYPKRANSNHNGYSEGSVVSPVAATRGINGKDVVYLTKEDMPRSVGMANIGGRMAYAARDIVWFSDVNQPGAVMASNFASFQADGAAVAIASFQDVLFVFSDIEMHSFTLRPSSAAGSPVPGIIDVVRVDTTKEAGCVSARSHCQTPYGVAFVSTWGVHFAKGPKQIHTISDPIFDHWGDGLMDPMSSYTQHDGVAKIVPNDRQPPIRYSHSGSPEVSYDILSDTIFICYETHLLACHVESGSWSVWPLGVRSNLSGAAMPIKYDPTFTGIGIVSDIDTTYLIHGLFDQGTTHTNDYGPYVNPSYAIAELGFGGGRDRTIQDEDQRTYGEGKFKLMEPLEAYGGGAAPPLMDPSTAYVKNGWLLFIELVDEWFDRSTANGTDDHMKKSYDVSLWVNEGIPYPSGGVSFKIGFDTIPTVAGYTFASAGSHPESGTRTGFTIAGLGGLTLSVVTPSYGGAAQNRQGTRIPLVRFVTDVQAQNGVDPAFILKACEATEPIAATTYGIRAIVWQGTERFLQRNHNWVATSTAAATGGIPDLSKAVLRASNSEADIEWGLCSGSIGLNDGSRHRLRDIRATLSTSGYGAKAGTEWAELYNATVGSDYKMLSGQRVDYADPYIADRDAMKKESVRNRMLDKKRVFSGGAIWSDGTNTQADAYIVDEPELNEIDISTYAKGDSVMVMIFGRVASIATYFKVHKLAAHLQTYAANRRKGR